MQFPIVTGFNLQRKKLTLPQDFKGSVNLIFIAFQQWQQKQVDTWVPYAQQLEKVYDGLLYYELPTIRKLNLFSRTLINEGMRAGIPNPTARERTITLYVDIYKFRDSLELPDEDNIFILLLDQQDNIVGKENGIFTPEKGESLEAVIRNTLAESNNCDRGVWLRAVE